MAFLLSLDPAKQLDFTPETFEPKNEGDKPTEKHLFEALWIAVKGVSPSGAELETAMSLKSDLRNKSIDGGSIKLSQCPCCGQRWMQHKGIRTITEKFDLVLESEQFNYMKGCMDRWQMVGAELQEYFLELKKRFKKAEEKSPEDWKKFIEERDAKVEIPALTETTVEQTG